MKLPRLEEGSVELIEGLSVLKERELCDGYLFLLRGHHTVGLHHFQVFSLVLHPQNDAALPKQTHLSRTHFTPK